MDKIIKNKTDLELVTSCSSYYKASSEKFTSSEVPFSGMYYLTKFNDMKWFGNIKEFLSYSENFKFFYKYLEILLQTLQILFFK